MKALYYTLIVIIFDQITKLLVKGFKIPFLNINHRGIKINQSIKIWDDFIQLTHVENYGIAFGIDFGRDFKVFTIIITLIAILIIFYYLYISRFKAFKIRLAIALILGGAIGNMIDRIFYGVIYGYAPLFHGRVVDFIHLDFFDYTLFGKTFESLPIFNLADVAVFSGVVMLLRLSLKSHYEYELESESTVQHAQENSLENLGTEKNENTSTKHLATNEPNRENET